MANSKKRCKQCKKYFPVDSMVTLPGGNFCTMDHALDFANEAKQRQQEKDRADREDFHRRIDAGEFEKSAGEKGRSHYVEKLENLVRQWVLNVRDVGAPCCTCGVPYKSIKFDAGHYRTVGAVPELRLELTNIHAQCHICNSHASGRRDAYNLFIKQKYGQDHYDWLNGPHPELRDQYPHIDDLKKEIRRYRKLLREAGLTPRR